MIIIGASELANIAMWYFKRDLNITHFTQYVEDEYVSESILPFSKIPPFDVDNPETIHIAIAQPEVRKRLFLKVKALGYHPLTYVNPQCYVDETSSIGENCFIFEMNTIQYRVKIGDNVVLWSGNHIGHKTKVGNHCFFTSHVVISGFCKIGESCYFGVNSCVGNDLTIGNNTFVGMGAVVHKNLEGGKVYVGNPAKAVRDTTQT